MAKQQVRRFFAYFPYRIGFQWRWWQWVTILYEYHEGGNVSGIADFPYWKPIKFLDE